MNPNFWKFAKDLNMTNPLILLFIRVVYSFQYLLIAQCIIAVLLFVSFCCLYPIFLDLADIKMKENEVDEYKRNAFYCFFALSMCVVICEAYFLSRYIENLGLIKYFSICMIAFFLFCCASYLASLMNHHDYVIKEKQTIIKAEKIEGIGSLDFIKNDSQSALIAYHENDVLRCSNEDRFLVFGTSGAGKTSFLIAQLIDFMKTGQSFVCVDIKPEIHKILNDAGFFEKFGYNDIVINPTKIDSDHFNIFAEVESDIDLSEILNIILPPPKNGDGAVFVNNARDLLKAVLLELDKDASLVNAEKYIHENGADLLKNLMRSDNEKVVKLAKQLNDTASNANLFASIKTSLFEAFSVLNVDEIRETTNKSDFRMRDVLQKEKQAIFLQFEQKNQSTTAPIFAYVTSFILRALLANKSERNGKAVLLLLDEIINFNPIPNFTEVLNTSRSKNMPIFMYLQNSVGIDEKYGNKASAQFFGSCNVICFAITDIDTAKILSEICGKTETKSMSYSKNVGIGVSASNSHASRSSSTSNSETFSYSESNIIDPADFLKIEKNHAVILYKQGRGKLKMPVFYELYP